MKNASKLTTLILAMLLSATALSSCGDTDADANDDQNDKEMLTVGISQFAEHGSLDNCREGFI